MIQHHILYWIVNLLHVNIIVSLFNLALNGQKIGLFLKNKVQNFKRGFL